MGRRTSRGRNPITRIAAGLCAWGAAGAGAQRPAAPAGVVVESVARGSAADAAGILPGDVLTGWLRTGPAGEQADGELLSPFDLAEAEVEQAPRGSVSLHGLREGSDAGFSLGPADWKIEARPRLSAEDLASYERARETRSDSLPWRELAARVREGGDPRTACWLLLKLGERQSRAGARPEADAAYAVALDSAPGPREQAFVHRARADSFLARWDYAGAEEALAAALEARRRVSAESLSVAALLQVHGNVAWHRGDLEAAEERYRGSLALRERLAPGSRPVGQILNNLANVVATRGDRAAATELYSRALGIAERLDPEGHDVATALSNLGIERRARGDLAEAEACQHRALAIWRKATPERDQSVATALHNLARVAEDRRDWDLARVYYEQALAINERLAPGGPAVALNLNNLGVLALRREDLEAAERHLLRALEVREASSPGSLEAAQTLLNLSNLEESRGRLDEAERWWRKAMEIQEHRAPRDLQMASLMVQHGELRLARGDLGGARAAYESALALRRHLSSGTGPEAQVLAELAQIARRSGEDGRALELYRQALDALDAQASRLGGPEGSRLAFGRDHDRIYRETVALLVDRGLAAEALHVLERSRARSFLALLAERDLSAVDLPPELEERRRRLDAEYDRTHARLGRLDPAREATEVERLSVHLRELEAARERIRAETRLASPRTAALRYPEPLSLQGVQAALDPGTVLLAYVVGEDRTDLFVVGGVEPALSVKAVPVGRAALLERVQAFRERVVAARPEDELAAEAGALFDLLVGPAEAEVDAAQRLLVSPDGPLHRLPFAALRRRGRYVVEWKPLHVVTSATVYAQLRQAPSPEEGGRLLAFGDPLYPSRPVGEGAEPTLRDLLHRGLGLRPLPASRREVEAIAHLYPGQATVYMGAGATEERAKAEIGKARYVHFACHAFLDERLPLNSALALAVPDVPPWKASDTGAPTTVCSRPGRCSRECASGPTWSRCRPATRASARTQAARVLSA